MHSYIYYDDDMMIWWSDRKSKTFLKDVFTKFFQEMLMILQWGNNLSYY